MEDEGLEDEDSKKRKRSKGEIRYVEGSVDCVSMVDDSTFLSGGDSGFVFFLPESFREGASDADFVSTDRYVCGVLQKRSPSSPLN